MPPAAVCRWCRPFTRGNPNKPRIHSLLYDHTSVLKPIEWRSQLPPLTARDASNEIANLVHALDLDQQDTSLPNLPVIANPPWEPCFNDFSFPLGLEAGGATRQWRSRTGCIATVSITRPTTSICC
jgi:hypothetical protein